MTDSLISFVENIDKAIGLEGIVILNKLGDVIFEKRWISDYPREIYSNTKSFTSAAVGIALYKGLLSLTDRPIDYFESYCAKSISEKREYWDKLQLKHLLTMQSGFKEPHLMYYDRRKGSGAKDYIEYMMKQEILYSPGTHFLYSSGDSILVACMVEKACGTSLLAFMYDNFFELANIDYPIWEADMAGHSCGAAGLSLKLKDMAKLGVVYLNEGLWEGKRLFSKEWARQSFLSHAYIGKNYISWNYGYYWKISRDSNVYCANGVFGQDTFVIPHLNLVIAIQCREETSANTLVYQEIERMVSNSCAI